jgi:hypothetical protein
MADAAVAGKAHGDKKRSASLWNFFLSKPIWKGTIFISGFGVPIPAPNPFERDV